MKKRILAAALSVVMLFGAIPAAAAVDLDDFPSAGIGEEIGIGNEDDSGQDPSGP